MKNGSGVHFFKQIRVLGGSVLFKGFFEEESLIVAALSVSSFEDYLENKFADLADFFTIDFREIWKREGVEDMGKKGV